MNRKAWAASTLYVVALALAFLSPHSARAVVSDSFLGVMAGYAANLKNAETENSAAIARKDLHAQYIALSHRNASSISVAEAASARANYPADDYMAFKQLISGFRPRFAAAQEGYDSCIKLKRKQKLCYDIAAAKREQTILDELSARRGFATYAATALASLSLSAKSCGAEAAAPDPYSMQAYDQRNGEIAAALNKCGPTRPKCIAEAKKHIMANRLNELAMRAAHDDWATLEIERMRKVAASCPGTAPVAQKANTSPSGGEGTFGLSMVPIENLPETPPSSAPSTLAPKVNATAGGAR